jgi:hypothetical protein
LEIRALQKRVGNGKHFFEYVEQTFHEELNLALIAEDNNKIRLSPQGVLDILTLARTLLREVKRMTAEGATSWL